jgi:acetylornithine deacetylase/succinyl-diaminopimelate desuccinylase-like protein
VITNLIASIDAAEVEKQALALSNDFTTRQSTSEGLVRAVDYVAKLLQDYGFETETPAYMDRYAPNVIGTINGTIVVLGTTLTTAS